MLRTVASWIRYNGGVANVGSLAPQASQIVKVRPAGESSLFIRYRDQAGVARSSDADIYLERDYSGTIVVQIRPDGKVIVASNGAKP